MEHALHPDEMGTMFSGSAVIDHQNKAGFGKEAMLLFYTAAGSHAQQKKKFTQCLAVSVDGKTFTKFEGNPVVDWIEADNRDPKVIWHASSQRWLMALYLDDDRYCLLNSEDGLHWETLQKLTMKNDRECPDFFPLTDDSGVARWIFHGANGRYTIGSFDGSQYTREVFDQKLDQGCNSYASQTWSNTPDGRCIQVSWMAGGKYPEMPFNQQLSIPVELSLLGEGDQVSIARYPIKELENLRLRSIHIQRQSIFKGQPLIPDTQSKLLDFEFTVIPRSAKSMYVVVRGHPLVFDWEKQKLNIEAISWSKHFGGSEWLKLPDTTELHIRVLVDTTSIEVFINRGEISASYCFLPSGYTNPLSLASYSGEQLIENFELHELKSVW